MFKQLAFVAVAITLGAAPVPALAADAPVVMVPHGDAAMTAAFAKAHATLDDFLVKLAHPAPDTENYAVKIGIKDAPDGKFAISQPNSPGNVEFFWIENVHPEGDGFSGSVGNDPDVISNVSDGDIIHFRHDDIADWLYFDHGKMIGNYTACPALAHDPAAAAQMRQRLGLVCD